MHGWGLGFGVFTQVTLLSIALTGVRGCAANQAHGATFLQGNARLLEYLAYMPSGVLGLLEYSAYWSTLTIWPTRVFGRPTRESGIFGILGTLQCVAAGELGLLEYSQ